MRFEWDEAKNNANIRKHGIDFNDAHQIFSGPMFVARDTREEYGEDRWIGIGSLYKRIVVVVFTETYETIRIISARKALKHESKIYEKEIKKIFDE